ncbi:hypothetical protein AK812_SmicGene11314 [Symbiodinium microadriaticum]|uniref:Uncharacterized protein n=1 Tax=Symbiodinium microadriaticum TaxID=2951 RepID=A0A1Q9EDK9_SYMMI|nr:hypothetical protein AK812_SmicGene11314 [Symbiodinium microadriaticum]
MMPRAEFDKLTSRPALVGYRGFLTMLGVTIARNGKLKAPKLGCQELPESFKRWPADNAMEQEKVWRQSELEIHDRCTCAWDAPHPYDSNLKLKTEQADAMCRGMAYANPMQDLVEPRKTSALSYLTADSDDFPAGKGKKRRLDPIKGPRERGSGVDMPEPLQGQLLTSPALGLPWKEENGTLTLFASYDGPVEALIEGPAARGEEYAKRNKGSGARPASSALLCFKQQGQPRHVNIEDTCDKLVLEPPVNSRGIQGKRFGASIHTYGYPNRRGNSVEREGVSCNKPELAFSFRIEPSGRNDVPRGDFADQRSVF